MTEENPLFVKHPLVIFLPAVEDVEIRPDPKHPKATDHVLRLKGVELGEDWFEAAKDLCKMREARIDAGCKLHKDSADWLLYVEGELVSNPKSMLINDTASALARNKEVPMFADAFLAPLPKTDDNGDELYHNATKFDWYLADLAYDLLCAFDEGFDIVEITVDGKTHSSCDSDNYGESWPDEGEPTQTYSQHRLEADLEDQYYNEPHDDR